MGRRGSARPARLPEHLCQSPAQHHTARPFISHSVPRCHPYLCLHHRRSSPAGRRIRPQLSAQRLVSLLSSSSSQLHICLLTFFRLLTSLDIPIFLLHPVTLLPSQPVDTGLNLEVLGPASAFADPLGWAIRCEVFFFSSLSLKCSVHERGLQKKKVLGRCECYWRHLYRHPALISLSPCL